MERVARVAPFGPSAVATPANAVTTARLVATPLMVLLIVRDGASWGSVAAWFALSCTDGLDGYLARRLGATRSGAFLDPLADKICVLAAMVTLVAVGTWWWPAVGLIAAREVLQTAWRYRLGRRGISVPASRGAKVKTLVQDLAVGAALLPWTAGHHRTVQVVLWTAVVLTVATGVQYLAGSRRAAAGAVATVAGAAVGAGPIASGPIGAGPVTPA
jgi:CDP-diacylglycerol--glycerol-3-phosphate 3-phosphatidyltransferase